MAVREKQAARWVAVQRRRRRIPVAGVAQLRDTGRPAVVYGTCRKLRQLEHELRVTDVALIYDGVPMERDVRVGATTADGRLTGDGWRAYVEVDNSAKMTRRQYEAKWRCYEGVTDFVLVVAVAEARMERIRSWSEGVKGIALFSTFDRLRSGVAEPWVGFDGRTAAHRAGHALWGKHGGFPASVAYSGPLRVILFCRPECLEASRPAARRPRVRRPSPRT